MFCRFFFWRRVETTGATILIFRKITSGEELLINRCFFAEEVNDKN